MPTNPETQPPSNRTFSRGKSFKKPVVDAWFPGTCAEVHADVTRANGIITNLFDEVLRRGRTSGAEAEAASAAIRTTTDWFGLAKCDLIIRYPYIDKTQLFDLQADPHEMNDLATKPESAPKVAELMKKLQTEMEHYNDKSRLVVPNPKSPEWSPADAKPKIKKKKVEEAQ